MGAKKYQWGSTSIERMKGIDERLMKILFRAIRISSRRIDGIDMTIPIFGGLRTSEDQNGLFLQGVTRADGYEKKSYHQTGLAIDVIPYVQKEGVKGNAIYTKKVSPKERELLFYKVSCCILEAAAREGVKLQWGGNWSSFKDLPHFEIRE